MSLDPHTTVRLAAVYVTAAVTVMLAVWRRPTPRAWRAIALACAWNAPALLLLNVVAVGQGWWRFDADGGVWLGVPLDLLLAWTWCWSAWPLMLAPSSSLILLAAGAFAADLVLMPAAAPVVVLGPWWLVGEGVALTAALLPSQLLARWTNDGTHVEGRAALQVVAFTGLVVFMIPAAAITGSDTAWADPRLLTPWQVSLWLQILALPAIVGVSAVQEFATRGRGTPVPFDPPVRLVTSGIYAYVANPMQLAALLMLLLLALMLGNLWVGAAGVMAHTYSAGLAAWDEDADMPMRHGAAWRAYRHGVGRWWPRLRPWHAAGTPPARLYVGQSCGMCRQVAAWFEARGATALVIVPAEGHPSRRLTRITYESGDGCCTAVGVVAVARGLEHVHLGWAFLGALSRLPGVAPVVQLLVDASGGEPRLLAQPKLQ